MNETVSLYKQVWSSVTLCFLLKHFRFDLTCNVSHIRRFDSGFRYRFVTTYVLLKKLTTNHACGRTCSYEMNVFVWQCYTNKPPKRFKHRVRKRRRRISSSMRNASLKFVWWSGQDISPLVTLRLKYKLVWTTNYGFNCQRKNVDIWWFTRTIRQQGKHCEKRGKWYHQFRRNWAVEGREICFECNTFGKKFSSSNVVATQ